MLELLVGICVVAILVAIIIPSMAKVREGAMASTCMGNLRQIGAAVYLYVNDNNGYLPGPTNSPQMMWDEKLLESGAISDLKITRNGCPKSKNLMFGSYGYNYLQLGGFDFPAGKLSSVTIPRDTIMIADSHLYGSPTPMSSYQQYNLVYWDESFWSGQYKPVGHNGGVNILWVDGHVSWLKTSEVLKDPTPPGDPNHGAYNYYFRRNKAMDWPYNAVAPW